MSGDEAVRRQVMNVGHTERDGDGSRRRLVELAREEALELLGSVSYGRVVFTQAALPAIRPVNHLLDAGRVIIYTRLAASVSTATGNTPIVVAYEADQIDPERRLGWSVVVTGYARPIGDQTDIARLSQVLTPWVDMPMDTMIAITPQIVTGYRLTPAD